MNCNQKSINRKKGSSSVLIMMVMIFLVSLGVLLLVSARSNLTLAKKNAEWVQGYYELESLANKHFSVVKDKILNGDVLSHEDLTLLNLENFTLDETHTVWDENGYVLAYESFLPEIERTFYTEVSVVKENSGYKVTKKAWLEKARTFEYEDGLEFMDIGG